MLCCTHSEISPPNPAVFKKNYYFFLSFLRNTRLERNFIIERERETHTHATMAECIFSPRPPPNLRTFDERAQAGRRACL